jgi:hypothetical protein
MSACDVVVILMSLTSNKKTLVISPPDGGTSVIFRVCGRDSVTYKGIRIRYRYKYCKTAKPPLIFYLCRRRISRSRQQCCCKVVCNQVENHDDALTSCVIDVS